MRIKQQPQQPPAVPVIIEPEDVPGAEMFTPDQIVRIIGQFFDDKKTLMIGRYKPDELALIRIIREQAELYGIDIWTEILYLYTGLGFSLEGESRKEMVNVVQAMNPKKKKLTDEIKDSVFGQKDKGDV